MNEPLMPEQRARAVIDRQLAASGWLVCDRAGRDLVNHSGVAVCSVIQRGPSTPRGLCQWGDAAPRPLRFSGQLLNDRSDAADAVHDEGYLPQSTHRMCSTLT